MYRKSMPTTDAETLVHTLYLYLGYLNNKGIISNVILIFANWSTGFTRHIGAALLRAAGVGLVETTTAPTVAATRA